MVKADYNRDYYADLELPQNADVNDVKKQFRKLALKYHPDRNPGREAEVNAKFQTIQAAHEILTSPEQRSKYDAHRARRPGASNVRGNPWADVGRNFPPPPQRNRPNASSASSRPAGTTSSADRYAKFTNQPPPTPPRPAEDPKSRAEAFESMRPKPRPRAPTAPHSGAHTGSSSSGASTRPRPPDSRQTAYTASQQKKAEASFGNRTGRSLRSGFVPGSPMGDEPPVASSNYSSGRRHTSLFDEAAAPPPVPPRERPDYGSGLGADDGFPPNLDPRSSPYQTRSGERLNPFEGGTSVNRAKSTRESHRRAQDDPDHFTTPNRQRSFSVSDEPEGTTYPATEPRQANISRKATANTGNIPDSVRGSRFGDKFSSNAGPGMPAASSTGHGFHDGSAPPTTSGAAADGSHSSRAFRDGSDPHPNVYDVADPTTHPSSFPFEASPARPIPAASATVSIDRHSQSVWKSGSRRLSSGGRSMSAYSDLNVFEQKQFDLLDKLVGKEPMRKGETGSVRASQSKETRHPPESLSHLNPASRYHWYKETDKFDYSSFPQNPNNGIHTDAAEPSSFARNSADSINTRFVPDEHTNVNWQFNAGGDFSPSTNGAGSRRTQSGSRLGRRSPTKGRSRMAGMAAGAAAATAAGMAASGAFRNVGSGSEGSSEDEGNLRARAEKQPSPQQQQDQSGFDADVWSDKIGSEHFVPVPPPRGSGSPTRPPMRPPKRRPTVRMTKGGSAGLVEEEDTTSGEDRAGGVAVDGMDSSNAMDIDTPMGESTAVPQAGAANGVRGVPVEPSRPEWRAGDTNGFATTAPPTTVPVSDPSGIKPRFNVSNAAGSEDTDDFGAGFADLKNVEPIAQRAAGLNSFDDLKTHLPFESRASVNVPVDKPKGSQEASINFPKPPVPPRAPAPLAISGLKPSGSAWEAHVHEFEIYLREWDNFNSKFVDHVLARQNQLNKAKQKSGLSLLYARNVKTMQDYASWLEQDQQVHEKWTAYHKEHLKRVQEFMAHQEKMKE